MIQASVLEEFADGTTKGRGEYKFAALPSAGDKLILHVGMAPFNDILLVLGVEHRPVEIPTSSYAKLEPTATIFAKSIGQEDLSQE
jgi:hypothetical protein